MDPMTKETVSSALQEYVNQATISTSLAEYVRHATECADFGRVAWIKGVGTTLVEQVKRIETELDYAETCLNLAKNEIARLRKRSKCQ